jgi:uncharacterized protein
MRSRNSLAFVQSLLLLIAVTPSSAAQPRTPSVSQKRLEARRELGQLGVEYSRNALARCAAEGDTIAVNLLLAAGMSPNVTGVAWEGGNHITPLHAAATNGHLETVQALLAGGAKPNDLGALGEAAFNGHTEVIRLLLESGADAKHSYAALRRAAQSGQVEAAKLLLDKGVSPNQPGDNESPLMTAATQENPALLKLLVERGANVNYKNEYGTTALTLAVKNKKPASVKLLLEKGADVSGEDKGNHGTHGTALLLAAQGVRLDLVQALLDAGASANETFNGRPVLLTAVLAGSADIVKALIAKGADVNAKTPNGDTALKMAGRINRPDLVQLLMSAGAKE